jgi:hypothetical protein
LNATVSCCLDHQLRELRASCTYALQDHAYYQPSLSLDSSSPVKGHVNCKAASVRFSLVQRTASQIFETPILLTLTLDNVLHFEVNVHYLYRCQFAMNMKLVMMKMKPHLHLWSTFRGCFVRVQHAQSQPRRG